MQQIWGTDSSPNQTIDNIIGTKEIIGSTKNNREKLKEYAKKNGISFTGEVYFKGVHQMTPYKEKEYNLPITEEFCENHVCPPLYPELTATNVLYVCKVMNNFKNLKK